MKHLFCIMILSCISLYSVNAATVSERYSINSMLNFNPHLMQLNSISKPAPEVFRVSGEKENSNRNGIVSGIGMISGGAILFAIGHIRGRDAYSDYKKSAFTNNTDDLRKKVQIYNALRIAGGVIGGAGIVVLAVSF
ncbi:MAG TPA: hypothetical protein VKO63_02985 [Chitinispirillaceae bacterium]|nr:hypothetical protein [Chitinispirillaceae bacterium]